MNTDLTKKHCVPCEAGTAPFTNDQIQTYTSVVPTWEVVPSPKDLPAGKTGNVSHKITKRFKFRDFREALGFVNKVGEIAEKEGHHPDIKIVYNRVILDLFTHAIWGLSENDFIMAVKIDQLI